MKKIILTVSILLFFFSKNSYAQSEAKIADSLYYGAKDFYYDGDYKKAKSDFEKALQIQLKINGAEHEDVVKTYFRLGKTEKRLRYHKLALETLEKGLDLAQKVHGESSEDVAGFYFELGNVYIQMYVPKKAKFYFEKCIGIVEENFGKESLRVGDIYMNLGNAVMKMANYRDAEKYHQKAFAIYKKTAEPKSKRFNQIYLNLSNLYRKMGDFDKSIEYGRKALEIKLLNYKETHPSVPKYYMNIGKAYAGKGAVEKGLPYLEKTVELQIKASGENHPEAAGTYGELANFYAALGRSEEALALTQKGLAIKEKRLSLTHPYVVADYNNIGRIYESMQKYNQALNFYSKSIEKYLNHEDVPHSLISRTYEQIAHVYLKKNELDSALSHLGIGMEYLTPEFNYQQGEESRNPTLKSVQAEVDYLDLLELKAEVLELRFEKTQQKLDLENSLRAVELAVELIERMRRTYQSETARQDLNERVAPIFQTAVRVAFRLYELTEDSMYLMKSLNFSEKSKASILRQHMNENFALENAGIPAEALEALENLKIQISELEEQFFEVDSVAQKEIQNQLFDLKLIYETKIAELEKYNPQYFQLKYASPQLELEKLQEKISDTQTALVEYFYDENYLYTFVISQKEATAFRQKMPTRLENSIRYLRDFSISAYTQNTVQQNEKYIDELNFLHQSLWQNIEQTVQPFQKIIIVPHGVLNYLSFETLTPAVAETDFRTLPYLLKQHDIHYVWSLSVWQTEQKKQYTYKNEFVGFAPSFSAPLLAENSSAALAPNRANLSNLNFSQSEIENVHRYFSGNAFLGNDASEASFQEYAPVSKIIHLATHAFADDRQPMQSGLVFSNQKDTLEDGFLNAYEIYNMKLSADLAVMSACNTGFGQLAEGEGVISLGRAFSYAGCRSVMMSLWMANDQSTASLMNHFYENLAKGERKDVALKNAKLTYLENSDLLTSHPYFWAGMVAVGEMDAVAAEGGNWFWMLGVGFVGVLLLIFVVRRK